jgi:hypothetical protein
MTPEQRKTLAKVQTDIANAGGDYIEAIFIAGWSAGAAAQRITDAQMAKDHAKICTARGYHMKALTSTAIAEMIESQGKG